MCACENLRTRRTGGRDRGSRSAQAEALPDEVTYREYVVRFTIVKPRRERSARGMALPKRELGLLDARRARADQYRYALCAVALARGRDGSFETVLPQP